jgi:hypothetical protein
VLVAAGGIVGGYALYIKNGKPCYEYNWFTQSRYKIAGTEKLPAGSCVIRMEFEYDGGGPGRGGTVRLLVDDKQVASGRVDKTEGGRFSADETFDVGCDTGSPVSSDYQSPFPFMGVLKKVEITLGEDKLTSEEQAAVRQMHATAALAHH